ncbi:hypothetical protein F5X99DRAFT_379166 [Biscogniauxia marginata]|nr:hypothetical protein F5X99DRAFT_379166 [Biscogniauxia marginata]
MSTFLAILLSLSPSPAILGTFVHTFLRYFWSVGTSACLHSSTPYRPLPFVYHLKATSNHMLFLIIKTSLNIPSLLLVRLGLSAKTNHKCISKHNRLITISICYPGSSAGVVMTCDTILFT